MSARCRARGTGEERGSDGPVPALGAVQAGPPADDPRDLVLRLDVDDEPSVAGEFGEHPETAAARMGWALTAVRTAFGLRD